MMALFTRPSVRGVPRRTIGYERSDGPVPAPPATDNGSFPVYIPLESREGEPRRGLRPQHEGEREGGKEGEKEHEDCCGVAQSEVDLAQHHVLVDVGGERREVPVPE